MNLPTHSAASVECDDQGSILRPCQGVRQLCAVDASKLYHAEVDSAFSIQ